MRLLPCLKFRALQLKYVRQFAVVLLYRRLRHQIHFCLTLPSCSCDFEEHFWNYDQSKREAFLIGEKFQLINRCGMINIASNQHGGFFHPWQGAWASLAEVVVFPAPCKPTIKIRNGFSSRNSALPSPSSLTSSSLMILTTCWPREIDFNTSCLRHAP